MLEYAENCDSESLLSFLDDGPFATKIKSIVSAYGIESQLVDLWIDQGKTAILRFDGNITLYCTEESDIDEAESLINVVGYSSLFGEKKYVEKCCDEYKSGKVMKYVANSSSVNCEDASDRLHEIYDLIQNSIPGSFSEDGYMFWLSDFMHRYFSGLSRARCVLYNGEAAACCITAAETLNAAVISGVACNKELRGRGLGKQCVLGLTNELINEKKEVYVFVLNENAVGFYERIGFAECGSWAEIKL